MSQGTALQYYCLKTNRQATNDWQWHRIALAWQKYPTPLMVLFNILDLAQN